MYISQNHATPSKKSDPVTPSVGWSILCTTRVYLCAPANTCNSKTGKSIHAYVSRKRKRSLIPRSISAYSTTYEHANYLKEFAGIRSFRVSKDLV